MTIFVSVTCEYRGEYPTLYSQDISYHCMIVFTCLVVSHSAHLDVNTSSK